ncbi:sugar phosphate isomerase/epimerase family protein [Thalassoroseus pseudoceratinae]|uniref:sugar phosphate isomerase/epimerase family protein n=1 Tax=Thalassoroseus pseudoceratinae TaxID=2713176 RepID=UPI0014220A74|nr:sugar phosphate isomerase/epimerase family protein [Thalassoroseus pseudoceratinae]
MRPLRFAVATRCFRQPLKHAMQTAADSGATGIELDIRNEVVESELSDTGRRHLLHFLGEHGLTVAGTTFPLRSYLLDPNHLDARIGGVKRGLEFSYQLGAKVMTARLGRVPTDPDSPAFQTAVEVLNDIARTSNHIGVVLGLTPSRDSASDVHRLLSAVDQGPIGIHFDPAGIVMGGENVPAAFVTLHEFVQQVQVRDAVSDVDGGGVEVAVGRGDVVWDEFLAMLDEAPYNGWLVAERTVGPDPIGDIPRAIQYVKNVGLG